MSHEHVKPTSFHSSPEQALQAAPEEFLYLACLHEGTGIEKPDFLAVVDAETGRIVHETADAERRRRAAPLRLEPLQLGLPWPRPVASHRAGLPLLAHPHRQRRRRPTPAPDREGDRARGGCGATGYTRPHTVHCMPGDNIVISMLGDADGNGAGGFAVLDAKTFELKGRWENGGATTGPQLRLLVPAAQECRSSRPSSASRTPTRRVSTWPTSRPAGTGSRLHFWNLARANARADASTSARTG